MKNYLTMKMEEYKKLLKKKNKYGAKKTILDGITFDSKKEADYYQKLKIAKQSGMLFKFYRQVPFVLPGKVIYRLDFLEIWGDGVVHTEVKGYDNRLGKIKRKMVEEIYNIKIQVV